MVCGEEQAEQHQRWLEKRNRGLSVMAGEATKLCFAPMSRPSMFYRHQKKDVDGRDKPGHDGEDALLTGRRPMEINDNTEPEDVITGRGDEALLRADVPVIHVLPPSA